MTSLATLILVIILSYLFIYETETFLVACYKIPPILIQSLIIVIFLHILIFEIKLIRRVHHFNEYLDSITRADQAAVR